MITNTADQVTELRFLDAPPFPINFRCAQCSVPNIGAPKDPVNASHFSLISSERLLTLKAFILHVSTVHSIQPSLLQSRATSADALAQFASPPMSLLLLQHCHHLLVLLSLPMTNLLWTCLTMTVMISLFACKCHALVIIQSLQHFQLPEHQHTTCPSMDK
jgi:hypothetical protein